MGIKIYNIDEKYISYLGQFAPHLFQNKQAHQQNERKYIGIVLTINGWDYFAPLSSFKDKHKKMSEGLDFIKIRNYAVINLNNMFPVELKYCQYVDFSLERNPQYKKLLEAEYRIIRVKQDQILKSAKALYNHKIKNGNSTPLAKRCNDFQLLEEKARDYR